jgi:hypothetical protein
MAETSAHYHPNAQCPKCGSNRFELAALHLANSGYSPWVIQCKNEKCGAIFGVIPQAELGKYAKESDLFKK